MAVYLICAVVCTVIRPGEFTGTINYIIICLKQLLWSSNSFIYVTSIRNLSNLFYIIIGVIVSIGIFIVLLEQIGKYY